MPPVVTSYLPALNSFQQVIEQLTCCTELLVLKESFKLKIHNSFMITEDLFDFSEVCVKLLLAVIC